ncbi:MAG: 30S ribosomal protein THX [Chitinophagaceae bacterium]
MGRGDKKTAKGKRFKGSFGKSLRQKTDCQESRSKESIINVLTYRKLFKVRHSRTFLIWRFEDLKMVFKYRMLSLFWKTYYLELIT